MNEKRSWLEGPQLPGENEDPTNTSSYAGQALGLPPAGPGSIAGLFPRMLALLIDWLVCYALAWFITPYTTWLGDTATATLLLFVVWRVVSVWLFAQTPGHAVVGIGVARIDETAPVGLWRSAVRTLLTVFLFPPIIQDTDSRGMHDRATGTAVIRQR